jgi:hypothetical protein
VPATKLSPQCQPIDALIKGLELARAAKQDLLQQAAPGEKPFLIEEIQELTAQINAKKKELAACKKEHPYQPPKEPPPLPKECAALKKQMEKLKASLDKQIQAAVAPWQAQLHSAAPGEKSAIIAEIKAITLDLKKNSATAKELAAVTKKYKRCIIEHGGLEALDAVFRGTATMQIGNENTPDPFTRNVVIGMHFVEWDHRTYTVTKFPTLSATYDTPVGTVTTTMTLNGPSGGTYDPDTGAMSLSIYLYIAHSTDWAGNSFVHVDMGTTKFMDSAGKVSMDGSAPFEDGFLDGDLCWLSVTGTVQPHP